MYPEKNVAQVAPTEESKGKTAQPTIFVYRYDGSLQCSRGKSLALDRMALELEGIFIFSQKKKRDGLMHIQVCGAKTGMANVYEISLSDKTEAEQRNFRIWNFN